MSSSVLWGRTRRYGGRREAKICYGLGASTCVVIVTIGSVEEFVQGACWFHSWALKPSARYWQVQNKGCLWLQGSWREEFNLCLSSIQLRHILSSSSLSQFLSFLLFQLGTSLPKHVPGVWILGAFVTASVLRVLHNVELFILAVPYDIAEKSFLTRQIFSSQHPIYVKELTLLLTELAARDTVLSMTGTSSSKSWPDPSASVWLSSKTSCFALHSGTSCQPCEGRAVQIYSLSPSQTSLVTQTQTQSGSSQHRFLKGFMPILGRRLRGRCS